jgi:hypothetical protein
MTEVTYHGLFVFVKRTFQTMERAHQWARQAGVFSKCTFKELT